MPGCRGIYLILVAISAATLSAQNVDQLDLEKESALGSQLAAEIRARTTPVKSRTVQQYIDALGQRLASTMPYAQRGFTFQVVADDLCPQTHEPAAIPGGYVFVPVALFTAASDEAEFAGMLAHAMEHIAQRRGFNQAGIASIQLVYVGGWTGSCSGASVPAGLATSQRVAEEDADWWAIQVMAATGFDPAALLRYIERIQPQSDRAAALRQALGRIDDFTAIQREVRRLTESPTPKRMPSLLRRTPQ
jgi:beta-barrel assembly-enhancing protease